MIPILYRKELSSYFNSNIVYIFLAVFHVFNNFLFFNMPSFWDMGIANMSHFFHMLKFTFLFFIPAITMRLWAEEKQTGTLEITFTLPIRIHEIILGKFLAAITFLFITLLSTILLPVSLLTLAQPDIFLIICGYFASFLFGSAFIALGMYISWKSTDQMNAFLLTFVFGFFLVMLGYPPVLQLSIFSFLGQWKTFLASFSLSWHFDSLAQGVLDSRDFLYFFIFIFLFLYLNYNTIRWQR